MLATAILKRRIKKYIKRWEREGYASGIPDEADYRLEAEKKVGTWRRVCKSLLRNDYWCKGMSFTQHKSEAYQKYLDLMKRRRKAWNMEIFV